VSRIPLAGFIADTKPDSLPEVRLVDIGCSGGLHRRFEPLGDRLHAIGVDRVASVVRDLAAGEARPQVRYRAAEVVGPSEFAAELAAARADPVAGRSTYALTRSSAYAAARQKAGLDPFGPVEGGPADATFRSVEDPFADPFIAHHSRRMTEAAASDGVSTQATVDQILAAEAWDGAHALKIDTDGFELDVLLGAQRLLADPGLGFVEVECQFHGALGPFASIFSNIDRLLRDHGFSLFSLRPVAYGRRDLPLPFVTPSLSSTTAGQAQWADALYARDLGDPRYGAKHGAEPGPDALLRAAVLFDLYELPDCAAELLARLPQGEALIDHLAAQAYGPAATAAALRRMFAADPERFRIDRLRRSD